MVHRAPHLTHSACHAHSFPPPQHVDAQDRGSLSYNNFIDSLAVVDIDPGYDPFKVVSAVPPSCHPCPCVRVCLTPHTLHLTPHHSHACCTSTP